MGPDISFRILQNYGINPEPTRKMSHLVFLGFILCDIDLWVVIGSWYMTYNWSIAIICDYKVRKYLAVTRQINIIMNWYLVTYVYCSNVSNWSDNINNQIISKVTLYRLVYRTTHDIAYWRTHLHHWYHPISREFQLDIPKEGLFSILL